MRTNEFGRKDDAFSFGFAEFVGCVVQPCGTSCGLPFLVETRKDRNTEVISLWIVTRAVIVGEIEMEQPIDGKKPKRIWCSHNQVKKVLKKKKKVVEIVQETRCKRRKA